MLQLDNYIQYLGLILLFITVILFIKSYRFFSKTIAFNILFTYLVISLGFDLINEYMHSKRIQNLYLSHFYFGYQFILFSIFYLSIFHQKKQQILIKSIFFIVIIFLGLYHIIYPKELFEFNLLEVFITSFPLVIYSVIHLYNSLTTKGKYLYINAAILIYLSSSTLIFFLGNHLATFKNEVVVNIWFIHKLLRLVFLTLILLEWKNSFQPYKIKTQ